MGVYSNGRSCGYLKLTLCGKLCNYTSNSKEDKHYYNIKEPMLRESFTTYKTTHVWTEHLIIMHAVHLISFFYDTSISE